MPSGYSNANDARRERSLERQRRAHELAQTGFSPEQIAREIGVSSDTVKRMLRGEYLSILKRLRDAKRAKMMAKHEKDSTRHTVPAEGWHVHANGCRTRVTADTSEAAQRLLGRMA